MWRSLLQDMLSLPNPLLRGPPLQEVLPIFSVFERGVLTLGAPACISSEGFRLWVLRLVFRAGGSDFERSGLHFEQGVQTLKGRGRGKSKNSRPAGEQVSPNPKSLIPKEGFKVTKP